MADNNLLESIKWENLRNKNPKTKEAISLLTGFVPGAGDVQSGLLAAQDVKQGNYGSAALNSLGLLPFIPAFGGITAWHGSPARFENFDPEKIGTGVGNQLFTKGFYFAESPDVAKTYATPKSLESIFATGIAKDLKSAFNSGGIKKVNEYVKENNLQDYSSDINKFFNSTLYKVDIADEAIPKMIDYDKRLSEQPQFIQNIAFQNAKPMVKKLKEFQTNPLNKDLNLNTIYDLSGNDLIKALGGTGKAENILQNYGVTGVKYAESPSLSLNKSGKKVLDKTGAGTSNYVVYDPNIIKILERNGLLLP